MFAVDRLLLVAAVLVIFGILSSKFSARVGLPVLVLFIGVGMIAGSEGLGGIAFEDYTIAHGVATLALAVILFDGGMRTSTAAFRLGLKPALSLATAGVLLTAGITGAAAAWLLGLPLLSGFLLGSIISSTDAAAVFNVMRSSGVNIRKRLASVLEVESGSNDPMAVFLTIVCIELILGRRQPGIGLVGLFILQMGVGSAVGVAAGKMAVALINRVNLQAAGLYPIITTASGILAYGAAASLGGSGLLSVYLAGIAIGNSDLIFRRGTLLFNDAIAWLAQIVMFVLLGLLSFPSRLLDVAMTGVLLAVILIFVARPLAVIIALAPFRLGWREITFISWVGLKGAVPIVLATYPLIFGVPNGDIIFDVVFFVVLVSAISQGWSLPLLARRLHLQLPDRHAPPVTLEITSLKHVDGDILEYTIADHSRAANKLLREIKLPENVVVAMIARENRVIPPRGSTRIEPGDHVFVVLHPRVRQVVDRLFGTHRDSGGAQATVPVEFPLDATTCTLADLSEFYGVALDGPPDTTLSQYVTTELGAGAVEGASIDTERVTLRILSMRDNAIQLIGLSIHDPIQDS